MRATPVLLFAAASFAALCSQASLCGQTLYTEGPGVNPAFEDIRDSISNGYAGTTIDVNNALVEGGLYGDFDIQPNLNFHTLASSSINQNAIGNWSRWYQTDGKTQIFRLFPGEENVRNSRPLAARIEAFDTHTGWNVDDGEWHEWVARYTIVKPINAGIFQAKDTDDDDWSVAINMSETGKVSVTNRRPLEGQAKTQTLVENAIGQPFDIRIRDNGLDYEVYFGSQTQPFAAGQYVRNDEPGDNTDTRFRWGIYVGSNPVPTEAMIFVSHASVDPDPGSIIQPPVDDEGALIAGWETWSQVSSDTWNATQTATGVTAQAVGTHESGGAWYNFTNATVENGASSDGRYGETGPSGANPSVAVNTDGVTLSNGYDGFVDFTVTDTSGTATALSQFHFDTGAFRPSAATDWKLEVISGDITIGSIASGTATVNAGPIQDDESIDLTGLEDSTLEANGSVTFRLNFTGGGGEPGAAASGHHLFLDNVGITGLPLGLPGDFNGDGVVDAADFTRWRDNLGATDETAIGFNGDGGGIDMSDYEYWKSNFGNASPTATAVPEPSAALLWLAATTAIASFRRRRATVAERQD